MPAAAQVAFFAGAPMPALPPPRAHAGLIGWLRVNLFSSLFNTVLTLLFGLLMLWVVPPILQFLVFDAVWTGSDRQACLATPDRPEVGACWAFVRERLNFFIYGFYPVDQRWRVDIF